MADAPVPNLGALERQVMDILWDCPHELCTRKVLEQTETDLAYTTIATVLGNLARKGMVEKVLSGRLWAYRALRSRGEYVGALMTQALRTSADHREPLAHLVTALPAADRDTLRALLADHD
ncbi:BlaI/MecI/CopY family transcriptional regulator [Oerskovia turbata]